MTQPQISVLMPVHNAGSLLIDAVASILAQSIQELEVICVNDGSQDNSGAMLEWFASQDGRIRVVHQANAGIVAALNRGIELCRAPYVMRMDCDDISLRERAAQQLQFMESNTECVVVGGNILEMDSEADPLGIAKLSMDHSSILHNLMNRQTGHFHPATMIRTQALREVGGYRPEYQWVEDHDLWLRLSQVGQLANLDAVVLCYRQHASSVCWQRSDQQRQLMNSLMREAYQNRELEVPNELILESTVHRAAAGPGKWARAAAKGGFTRSAWKHLKSLNAGEQSLHYKMRMNLEVLMRLGLNSLRSNPSGRLASSRRNSIFVPTFADWHERWQVHCSKSHFSAA